ncbi:MAG TPA: hypothetical protein VMT94_03430 [Burkholderiales bacterium]|nr:hypothetical protein [Burkholderiales bacterium]
MADEKVDLEKVSKLIEALELDLARVRSGSQDVKRLRDEVETLKRVLNAPLQKHHWIREGLHSVREALDGAVDTAVADTVKAGQYIAEIGRILGM